MNDEIDCFEKNTVLRVRVLDLFRLWRLLRFVENDFKTLDKTRLLTRRREKLEEAEELAGQPRCRNEVISIVLEILIRTCDDTRKSCDGIVISKLLLVLQLVSYTTKSIFYSNNYLNFRIVNVIQKW